MKTPWYDKSWLRMGLVIFFGTALFLLGTIYIGIEKLPDRVTYRVIGGEEVVAGQDAMVRIQAHWLDKPTRLPVEVGDIRINGAAAGISSEPGDPAIAAMRIPVSMAFSAQGHLDVLAGRDRRLLKLPLSPGSKKTPHIPAPAAQSFVS